MLEVVRRYNGGRKSQLHCSDPSNLYVGVLYTVHHTIDREMQTDFALNEVSGHYNSQWFDVPPTYLAFAETIPVVGQPYKLYRCELANGSVAVATVMTSDIRKVISLGEGFFQVITLNSVYLVKVS